MTNYLSAPERRIPESRKGTTLLFMLLASAVGLATLLNYTFASRYLGVFLAGLAFCSINTVHEGVWETHIKPIHSWLFRIFFGATVAFEIPVRQFVSPVVWARACAFLVPFFAKLATGFLAESPYCSPSSPDFWKASRG